ncbi:BEM_HP_G0080680.mRNA.1.CDS.1 [Saccharomyces cerevisiae]|nr:BEM_HP_G0080680.mRNA.1.CDS.1 [Saccharomyces cerevisiae]CAI6992389.1 BEM_HP_G0080680.mRNA.1.CDS.1 [Saccharomyces cerevisiae]
MDNKPLKTINIHEQLKERLSDTYENDAIFDKFITSGDNDNGIVKTFDEHNAPNATAIKISTTAYKIKILVVVATATSVE